MEVTFFSFQMNSCSFTEISISKNEVNLLENIRNNLVNFEKTLTVHLQDVASILQKSFIYLSMLIQFTF